MVTPLKTPQRAKEAGLRVVNALIELVAHLAVLAALLIAIWALEKLVHKLWGTTEYVFFGKVKLKYIFDGADLALLVGFLVWGVYSVVAAYVRKPA